MILIDAAIQPLVQLLAAELPAALALIDAEYNDGLVCRAPRQVLDFRPADHEIPDTPIVCVLDGPTQFLNDTGFASGGFADARHQIAVQAILEDSAPASLARRLRRYQRGILQVCGAHRVGVNQQNGQAAWYGLSLERTIPGQRFIPDANPSQYGDSTTIILRVTRTEA